MSATILLAENEFPILELISIALSDAGFLVVQAADGQEAIKKLTENTWHLDALITDISLGPGPDGWDIGQVARQVLPSLPILYMSGDRLHEWPVRGVVGSMFLPKPFRLARLLDGMQALFGRMTQGAALPGAA